MEDVPPTTIDSNLMGQGVAMDCQMVEELSVSLRDEAGLWKVAFWRVTETGWRVSTPGLLHATSCHPRGREKITPELGKEAPFCAVSSSAPLTLSSDKA